MQWDVLQNKRVSVATFFSLTKSKLEIKTHMRLISNTYMDVVGMNGCVTGAAEDQVVHDLKPTKVINLAHRALHFPDYLHMNITN